MKITYNPLYKKDGKTLVGALSSASTDDIIFDLPGSAIWAKRKKFLGTDSNVLLSLTTTSNWRPITLGYQNDSKGSANLYKTVTLQIYTTNILQYLPSTGTLQTTILTSTGNTVVGGDIKMTAGGSAIHWNAGTYQQRILTTDDSTANTAVFTFLQSEDSAKTWKNLFTIYDNKYVEASGFVKTGSSNLYVLLGDGSHKALSDFSTAHSHPYLPLAGGTMTGDINFYFHADNTKPDWKPGTFNGLKWTGSSDSAYLYARCASGNDLEVHLNFTDDNAELFKIDWNGKTRITFGYNGVYSVGFHHSSHDSNDSVLLAGGSYKALSDFAMSNSKLPNPYSISFKNTSNTTVSYNGSAALDLTGGIYYSVYSSSVSSLGIITAISGTSRYSSGLRFGRVYNSGYPFSYGSTITMEDGGFGAELIFNGLGGGGNTGSGEMRFRTHSDWSTSEWGQWRTVLDSSNYKSFVDDLYWADQSIALAASNTTTPRFGAVAINLTINKSYKLAVNGNTNLNGTVYISNSSDVNNSAGSGALVIGNSRGTSIGIDDNEIIARNNGKTSVLYILNEGGAVCINNGGATYALNVGGTVYSTGEPGFYNKVAAGKWSYLRLHSGDKLWDIAQNSSRSNALEFRAGGGEPTMWLDYAGQSTSSGLIHMRNGLEVIDDSSNNSNDALALFRHRSSNDWTMVVDSGEYDYGIDIRQKYNSSYAIRFYGSGTYYARFGGNGTFYHIGNDSNRGINIASTWIRTLSDLVLITNSSGTIRFGNNSWDWNQWAGLRYTGSSDKKIYLGFPDNNVFNANSSITGGYLGFVGAKQIDARNNAHYTVTNSKLDYIINGPSYRTTSDSHTGAITIRVPKNYYHTMVSMWIDIYNYRENTSFSVHCGGYFYSGDLSNAMFAMVYGAEYNVRFGYDGSYGYIYIGETNSTWSHPQVLVRNIILGYSGDNRNNFLNADILFSRSFVSAINKTFKNYAVTTKNWNNGLFDGRYVTIATTQTISGFKTFSTRPLINTGSTENGIRFRTTSGDFVGRYSNYVSLYNAASGGEIKLYDNGDFNFNHYIHVVSKGKNAYFGSQNSSWCHIEADVPFYMNTEIAHNGVVRPYTNNGQNLGTSSYEWGTGYIRQIYARHIDHSANYTGDNDLYIGYSGTNATRIYSTSSRPLAVFDASAAIHLESNYNTRPALRLRLADYQTDISYYTAGNEALCFQTLQSVTSFIFHNGSTFTASSSRWYNLINGIQIKQNCLAINAGWANGVSPDYRLKVGGNMGIYGTIISYPNANLSASSSYTYPGGAYYSTAHPNIRLYGDSNYGLSTIEFMSAKGGTSINIPTDCAFIQFLPYGFSSLAGLGAYPGLYSSGEANKLIIGVNNDSDDMVCLLTPNINGLRHIVGTSNYAILNSGNWTLYIDGRYLRYEGWWNSGSGLHVNDAHGMVFAYGNHGRPGHWGTVVTFEESRGSGYRLQLAGDGWDNQLYYRNRSSDRGGWYTGWKQIWDSGNTYVTNGAGVIGNSYISLLYPINSNPNNSHTPGYGLRVWYSWNQGQANNASSGYCNGITIGSHPSDTAYGWQICQNMWDDRTYVRRYNGGWQGWLRLRDSGDTYVSTYGVIGGLEIPCIRHLLINGVTWWSNWNWSGLGGQPSWLWGSNDGVNMYIWNPSNFSVNYANYSGWTYSAYELLGWAGNECQVGAGLSSSSLWINYRDRYNGTWGTRLTAYYLGDRRGSWTTTTMHMGHIYSNDRAYINSNWLQINDTSGIYWPNAYGSHLYPWTGLTYCNMTLLGSKNGYTGLNFGGSVGRMQMMDNGTDKGVYLENWGWLWYFNSGNGRFSVRSSNSYTDISLYGNVYTSGWVYCHYIHSRDNAYIQRTTYFGRDWYGDTYYCNGGTIYTSTAYTNNWFRSYNATGWYNESYGGGIYMEDSTWVRIYGGKLFYVSSGSYAAIHSAGGVYVAGCVHAYANYLKSTCNSRTITIGSQNSSWCHYETSAPNHWFNVSVYANGHFYEYSDIRYKNIINYIEPSVEDISKLPIFNFTWIDKNDGIVQSGTSALAVLAILPYVVGTSDPNKLALSYDRLGVIASIIACRELVIQKSEVELLKERIYELEQRLAYFESHSVLNTDSIS